MANAPSTTAHLFELTYFLVCSLQFQFSLQYLQSASNMTQSKYTLGASPDTLGTFISFTFSDLFRDVHSTF